VLGPARIDLIVVQLHAPAAHANRIFYASHHVIASRQSVVQPFLSPDCRFPPSYRQAATGRPPQEPSPWLSSSRQSGALVRSIFSRMPQALRIKGQESSVDFIRANDRVPRSQAGHYCDPIAPKSSESSCQAATSHTCTLKPGLVVHPRRLRIGRRRGPRSLLTDHRCSKLAKAPKLACRKQMPLDLVEWTRLVPRTQ
jgi:hypothetical protein